MSKVKYSQELGFEIAKEYLNMPSTASVSRWLKASLTQNSEELIANEALEPFILICRIATTIVGTQKWLQCGAQNYSKDIKNRCDFTRHRFDFSRFYVRGHVYWKALLCGMPFNA